MKLTVTNEEVATLVAGWTKIYTYSDNAGPDLLCGTPPSTLGADAHGEWTAITHESTKPLTGCTT
jgi:hypothetical protein